MGSRLQLAPIVPLFGRGGLHLHCPRLQIRAGLDGQPHDVGRVAGEQVRYSHRLQEDRGVQDYARVVRGEDDGLVIGEVALDQLRDQVHAGIDVVHLEQGLALGGGDDQIEGGTLLRLDLADDAGQFAKGAPADWAGE